MSSSAEFELCLNCCQKVGFLGLITWLNSSSKIVIEFYFDEENIDMDIMPYILNKMVENSPRLLENGWKPNFKMYTLKPDEEIDYYKKVKFVLKKKFFFRLHNFENMSLKKVILKNWFC